MWALLQSSLGKKYLVGLTGLVLFCFVLAHLIGNLQIFLGAESINRYGNFLKTNPEILWSSRLGLIVVLVIHVWTTILLAIQNRAARNQDYAIHASLDVTAASKSMVLTGGIVIFFVAFHLAHYTFMVTHPEFKDLHDGLGRHDVYRMMILGFSDPKVTGFYLIGVGFLSFHLSHGVQALFQTIGFETESNQLWIRRFAWAVSWLIFIGYVSIPVSILTGVVQ